MALFAAPAGANVLRGVAPRLPVLASAAAAPQPRLQNAGQAFTAGYEGLVRQFLADVAADGGLATNVYAVTAQYGPSAAADPTRRYQIAFAPADVLSTTDPYPADQANGNATGCRAPATVRDPSDPPYTRCVTDRQIQQELDKVVTARGLPVDLRAIYFVMLPPGIDVCSGAGPEGPANSCADTDFCGYHANVGTGTGPVYAVIPYAGVSGCESGQAPNGAADADAAVSLLSHEHNDAITDPLLGGQGVAGWYDTSTSGEVADKCARPDVYGTAQGAPGSEFNQTINGDRYYVQDEFAVADGGNPGFDGCEQRPGAANDGVSTSARSNPVTYHGGPVLGPHTAYVLFWGPSLTITASSASAHVGQSVTFTATLASGDAGLSGGTYAWDFGDGGTEVAQTPTVSHAFRSAGTHLVTVSVAGQTATASVYVYRGPAVSLDASRRPVHAGARVVLSASGSTDPDGTITSWSWSFGDGTGATGRTVRHTYALPGRYRVTITERDSNGSTASASAEVEVWGFAAALTRVDRASVARARAALVVRTGWRLRCIAGPRCTVRLTLRVPAGAMLARTRLTVRKGHTAALDAVVRRGARPLLTSALRRTLTVVVKASAPRAFAIHRTFRVRV